MARSPAAGTQQAQMVKSVFICGHDLRAGCCMSPRPFVPALHNAAAPPPHPAASPPPRLPEQDVTWFPLPKWQEAATKTAAHQVWGPWDTPGSAPACRAPKCRVPARLRGVGTLRGNLQSLGGPPLCLRHGTHASSLKGLRFDFPKEEFFGGSAPRKAGAEPGKAMAWQDRAMAHGDSAQIQPR